jgi:uncharacterized SAM-binding protein YcdF (DUF218 family)
VEWASHIVVLGCALTPAATPGPALQRRVAAAAAAWHLGRAPRIMASGGRRWWGHAEASVMRDALLRLGVPEAHIELELCSLTTKENALYCHRLIHSATIASGIGLGLPRIILVSCDWHLPRALGHFRRAGFACEPLEARAPRGTQWALNCSREVVRGALDVATRCLPRARRLG